MNRAIARGVEVFAVVAFTSAIVAHGVPAIRHDWSWPTNPDARAGFLWGYVSGWDLSGFGEPNARTGSYLLAVPLWLLMQALAPVAVLAIFSAVIGWVTFRGARLLAQSLCAPALACSALGFCALFNPWVYTEVVAGHLAAVLAFGLSLEIAALVRSGSEDAVGIGLRLGIVLAQFQLFIVDVMGLLLLFGRRRAIWKAAGVGGLFALPVVAGLIGDRSFLGGVPYTLEWQKSQSLAPLDAVALLGYFANYTVFSEGWFRIGMGLLAVIAAAGAALRWRSRRVAVSVALFVVALIVVTGARGPAAALYDWVVLHAQWSGAFRELFTIACYLVVFYVALASAACARLPILRYAVVCAGLGCAIGWIVYPPFRWFVPGASLPIVPVDAAQHTRFVLLPAVQPVTFGGLGSGVDPDAYPRPGGVTPLNTYSTVYPGVAAFEMHRLHADDTWLRALSVSTVLARPWLQTDDAALREQLDVGRAGGDRGGAIRLNAAPELALSGFPTVGSLDRLPDRSGVFFGDVVPGSGLETQPLSRFDAIVPDRERVDPSEGWVDARFLFYAYPEIAQGLGGVGTSGTSMLYVDANEPLLAAAAVGVLRDDTGHVVLRAGEGFRWIRIAHASRGVRCAGVCAVAGQSSGDVTRLPLDPAAPKSVPVSFSMPLPWLVSATLPAGDERLLRFNTSFDDNWVALTAGTIPIHLRLDTIANGWIVSPRSAPTAITLVHVTSAIQAILEVVLLLLALALLTARARARVGVPR